MDPGPDFCRNIVGAPSKNDMNKGIASGATQHSKHGQIVSDVEDPKHRSSEAEPSRHDNHAHAAEQVMN